MSSKNNMSLTKVAEISRKAIYLIAIGFVVLAFTTYFVRQYQDYQRLHPPKVKELPNYRFGKLPKINFPVSVLQRQKPVLELATGFFPVSKTTVKVFLYITQKTPGFDPVENARVFARKNGFTAGEIKQNENQYAFLTPENQLKKMLFNVVDQSFEIQSDIKTDYSLLTAYNLPSPTEAKNFALAFLNQNDLWAPLDLENQTKIFYYKISPDGNLQKTLLPFEANLIKVVFSRNKIDEMTSFSALDDDGPVVFLLTGSSDGTPKIAELKYYYFPIDEINFGKYFLKKPAAAWEEFISGKEGFVSSYGELETPIVRNIFLGLYDSLDGKGYLQPVWVFEGDKGFRAFVPAVDPR